MDALIKCFWWGAKASRSHYLAFKSWGSLCQPKKAGGLGFRKFKDINIALLTKLGWKLAKGEESLWTRLLKAKYLKNKTFFGCKFKAGNFYVWKSILCSKDLIQRGSCYKVGNDWSIDPRQDPWVMEVEGKVPKIKEGVDDSQVRHVANLLNPDTCIWDEAKL
ncbi:uncharacterized mitochondrial protein AtMg00310-like [Ziziphus jujuba]|uniref:Uncharacterized mitochondrial protein AtMg00310-like n=1 Tax=Ziziphus jujuba TaxID=326968 RepID=A0A6P3Z950_ZIZJJ|nr:uncharacterized mitochondrial protein AtMg00310-like [Ziziphus jujuba]